MNGFKKIIIYGLIIFIVLIVFLFCVSIKINTTGIIKINKTYNLGNAKILNKGENMVKINECNLCDNLKTDFCKFCNAINETATNNYFYNLDYFYNAANNKISKK